MPVQTMPAQTMPVAQAFRPAMGEVAQAFRPAMGEEAAVAARRLIERSAIARALADIRTGIASETWSALVLLAVAEVEPAWLRSRTTRSTPLTAILAAPGRLQESAPGLQTPAHEGATDAGAAASTAFGGLLFVLNVVARLGVPDAIVADARWIHRGLRWVLHQLAIALCAADATDPAVLAFAGLQPDAPAPDSQGLPPTDDELVAVDRCRETVMAALRESIGRADEDDAALVDRLCRRRARISSDPGWIEIVLSLDDVDVDVRRAGLDLDPGWLPWLGVVVRFVYE